MLTGEQSKGIIYHNARILCKLKLKKETSKRTGNMSAYKFIGSSPDDKLYYWLNENNCFIPRFFFLKYGQ